MNVYPSFSIKCTEATPHANASWTIRGSQHCQLVGFVIKQKKESMLERIFSRIGAWPTLPGEPKSVYVHANVSGQQPLGKRE